MIELQGVSFQYENSAHGIFDINLSVREGECVVLTGPSGHGKTTLTRLINGLAPSYYSGIVTGAILIDGIKADTLPPWQKGRMVGSVFQNPKSQFFSSELPGEVAFCGNP